MKNFLLRRLLLTVMLVVVLTFTVVFAVGCGDDTPEGNEAEEPEGGWEEVDLVIALSDISSAPNFFGVTVNGTYMEIIAFDAGGVRTMFNTCQSCYGSREAYFEVVGKYLECQNCKNKFLLTAVGVESSGCNPVPILEDERTITEDSLTIGYEILAQHTKYFKKWKNN